MTKNLVAGVIVAVVLAVVSASAQQTVFRGSSDVVRVYVTATDREGRLVTTLTQDDFDLRDEGKPQPITQFDNSPQPVQLVVLLDVSGSMEGNLPLLRTASEQLFARLAAEDRAKVGSFGHEISISPLFTRDREVLRAALPRQIAPDAPTPLWRAIDEAINSFNEEDDRRRVVLVLSDGKDTGSMSFREKPASQAEVIDRARREDVMIYGVAMRSRSSQRGMPGAGPGGLQAMMLADMPDPGLARVAEETGGGFIEIRMREGLGETFAAVVDELHTQYLLGFALPKRDGKVHDLSVKIKKDGTKSRARKSYLAPK